ncbi:hypothetical protein Vretimale_870, partial [Volvox reticuliferus]
LVLQRMKCINMELAVRSSTCTGKEVVAAAKLLLHPALSSASEHLHLLHCPNGIERAPYLPLDAEAILDDAFFTRPGEEKGAPRLVLVRTQRHTGLKVPAGQGPVYKQLDEDGIPVPTWAVIHLVKLRSPLHPRGKLYFQPVRRVTVLPMMVPLTIEQFEGGKDAEAAVIEHIM